MTDALGECAEQAMQETGAVMHCPDHPESRISKPRADHVETWHVYARLVVEAGEAKAPDTVPQFPLIHALQSLDMACPYCGWMPE